MKNCKHVLLLGDMNCWVGNEPAAGNTVGRYNLSKQNLRGEQFVRFCADHNLFITSTHRPHTVLETRMGNDGSQSSPDYVICSKFLHKRSHFWMFSRWP
eukprot:5911400-Amphidinium_carterae.1